uniref:Uncharacterized protein n=1 Tax=Plectus sambesii TaxID=2011161 RepID=A0A914W445_9BILA
MPIEVSKTTERRLGIVDLFTASICSPAPDTRAAASAGSSFGHATAINGFTFSSAASDSDVRHDVCLRGVSTAPPVHRKRTLTKLFGTNYSPSRRRRRPLETVLSQSRRAFETSRMTEDRRFV